MWKELFTNACILVTIFFISSQIITNRVNRINLGIKARILLGILGGLATIVLIEFSIHITPTVVMDFRHVTQILIAIFGGFEAVIIAGLISAVFRMIYMGITTTSVIASVGVLIVSGGLAVISKFNMGFKMKWTVMSVYSLMVYSIIIGIIFDNMKNLWRILIVYWMISTVVAIAIYYLVQYFMKVNSLFERLKRESAKDFLTGLNNTRQFDLAYNDIQSAVAKGEKVALLIIDIDHFKNVNDTYGHVAGDEVLKEMSLLILQSCRGNDYIFRIGGEEFAVIIKNLGRQEVTAIAKRIRINVEKHFFKIANNKSIQITASIGVAVYPDTVNDTKNLKEFADIKLYEAKRTGRNKVCF